MCWRWGGGGGGGGGGEGGKQWVSLTGFTRPFSQRSSNGEVTGSLMVLLLRRESGYADSLLNKHCGVSVCCLFCFVFYNFIYVLHHTDLHAEGLRIGGVSVCRFFIRLSSVVVLMCVCLKKDYSCVI